MHGLHFGHLGFSDRLLVQLPKTGTYLQSGPRILTGLVLIFLGAMLSYPVFIGQHGDGLSWWPAMMLAGLSWFLLGAARLVINRLS